MLKNKNKKVKTQNNIKTKKELKDLKDIKKENDKVEKIKDDNFIDDLFSKKVEKKQFQEEINTFKEEKTGKKKAKGETIIFKETKFNNEKPKIFNDDEEFFDSRGNKGKRKLTEEGYPIYDIKELKIGEGEGDTPLCPFDCNCCF